MASSSTSTPILAGPSSTSTSNISESAPLLQTEVGQQSGNGRKRRKPFYRARPLWLVPFAVTAALVRGMTLAPRVEVLTQLACTRLHGRGDWNHTQHAPFPSISSLQLLSLPNSYPDFDSGALSINARASLLAAVDPLGPHLHPSSLFPESTPFDSDNSTTRLLQIPSQPSFTNCAADPAVQAGAARLQTLMSTTLGLLSALTTGWWGQFGERHGRTRVLAIATFGLVITDLTFILLSTSITHPALTPVVLLLAPALEGALGGWSTLQSATSAYLSDCTSPGSRAGIFSRFTGVLYLGFAVGPSLGGWLIRHPIRVFGDANSGKDVTSVFYVAALCSLVNFLLVLFVFPESLSEERRARAMTAYTKLGAGRGKAKSRALTVSEGDAGLDDVDVDITGVRRVGLGEEEEETQIPDQAPVQEERGGLLRPLAVFLPVLVLDPSGLGKKRRDWSLTLLAAAMFGAMLSMGVYQLKYLYATHTFEWGPEQLSYYISFMGGARALFLLFVLPSLIGFFKPRPISSPKAESQKGIGKSSKNVKAISVKKPAPIAAQPPSKKPKPTRAQLGEEIAFDLALTRCSLMIDIASHTLVALLPAPGNKSHVESNSNHHGHGHGMSFAQAEAAFVVASSLNSMGSGAVPAIQSLALCVMQVRAMDERRARGEAEEGESSVKEEGTGPLFGALAVLQAIGQMILGPMLFGLVYSETVAQFPKAIFVTAAAILMCALLMLLGVRNPVRPAYPGRGNGKGKKRRESRDVERGRSRASKDLRGGAIGYYGAVGTSEGNTM